MSFLRATLLLSLLTLPFASGCWVTEQCSVPGDEDGDGLEGCDDPDCASRSYCGGFGGGLVPPGIPPGADDDDDVFDDDDFDDDDFDDDDDVFEEATGWSFSFTVTSTPVDPGDDDDSAAGDDDDAGDGEFVAYDVQFEYVFNHWIDLQNGIPLCDQVIAVQGTALFGPGIVDALEDVGDCAVCTGFIELDESSVTDISDPAADPDHCDQNDIELNNIGISLLSGPEEGGQGDFLSFATVDADTMERLGLRLTVNEGGGTDWESIGMVRTHGAYVRATPETLAGTAGLEQITLPPEAGSDYLGAFEVARLVEAEEPEPYVLSGEYVGRALFILN